ncbi:neuroepithelial cell-transforming gene 1 protein isoform X1 [Mustela nigripes]|uniref:Neuroepithelial cell-transforming gene 1 protein isoform X1 n=1 Tax=Mustela putorius furo TaxID=9669 RepID=A0A8U0RQG7_MUSPF|nr:neuroepithelial cell-transforming gene 1 protein isoform X1 [Mustela putorius furo]XP_059039684.1 neuroepithelial cell-transforming gene 1 protein isoform X1 [Mustela lutreola]XP_059259975.1 neuroepithelial cell-transforming gene 1 protein isoform X1 [Mustela nigripes]
MEPELAAQKQPRPRRRSRRASGLNAGGGGEPSADTPRPEPDGRHSLRRGSSFTFLTPGPHWDFTLKRKRRAKDDDVISLNSLDLKEPSNKRVRPLARVTSLANLISPVRNGAVRRFGQTIQSFTLRGDSRSPASAQKLSSRSTVPTPAKRRSSVLWSEMLDVNMKESLTTKEIKRQEAIYEMSRGEQDLIEDLKLARKAYHDPMLKLSIMSEEELTHIFGDLDAYIPLHEDLLARIGEATKPGGTVEQIGHILVNWLPGLNAYKGYCSNQLAAKALLDQKKQDPRVQDFLQRCLESPFSRKLDLWSFLDIPRSRLVKYPLLLKEILRHTPKDHPDVQPLEEAILIIQGVLSDINLKKGESECQYYIDKLEYLDEKQKDPRIEASKVLLCHGELKNKSGHKLYIFLFQDILVLTRPVTRNERHFYQVYRQPIPVQELVLEDLQDGDVRMGGSFRGAFSNSDKAKNIFRVRFQDPSPGQSHTLQANDVFHKQQWFNCIRAAIAPFQQAAGPAEPQGLPELHEEGEENSPSAGNVRAQRRVSTASSVTQVQGAGDASESGCPGHTAEDMKSAKVRQTQPGLRKARDRAQVDGKRKETLV